MPNLVAKNYSEKWRSNFLKNVRESFGISKRRSFYFCSSNTALLYVVLPGDYVFEALAP
jgi:hypothetical protein